MRDALFNLTLIVCPISGSLYKKLTLCKLTYINLLSYTNMHHFRKVNQPLAKLRVEWFISTVVYGRLKNHII